ncbi:MAG: hypothetical protein IMX00_03900 [Limnochordales bacterium]|nr:hypothetical protein [Limnochordales bacterium]
MRRWAIHLAIFSAVVVALMVVVASPGRAAEGSFVIGAYPLELEHQTAAGKSVSGTFQVYNGTDETLHFTTTLADWQISPDGDLELAPAGSLPRSASPWVRVSPREFDVPAKGTFTVRYAISVPATVADGVGGEYRSMIVAQSQALPSRTGGIMIAGAVAIKVFVQIGAAAPGLAVTDLREVSRPLSSGAVQPPSFQVQVKNTGNVHLRPVGRLEVRQGDRLLYQLPINEAAATVLPDATRIFTVALPEPLPSGDYQIIALFDYGGAKLTGGRLNYRVPAQTEQP